MSTKQGSYGLSLGQAASGDGRAVAMLAHIATSGDMDSRLRIGAARLLAEWAAETHARVRNLLPAEPAVSPRPPEPEPFVPPLPMPRAK